jgi:DNA-binding Xre family transcriptional regulator
MEPMPMYINLKTYLSSLEAIERSRPANERKQVPNLSELARSLGMHQTSINRIANNQVNQLSLETADKIITEMRKRGFLMQVGDLLAYREVGS